MPHEILKIMPQTKIIALNKPTVISLITFATLLAAAIFAPLLHNQLITGSIVNAVLFLAAMMLGWPSAVAIGALPSLIAAISGTLPAPLIPMTPFIITSNAILIAAFYLFKNKNYWVGAVAGSVLKFLFLYSASAGLFNFIWPQKIAASIAVMMNWPQLITALLGATLAYLCLKMIKSLD